MRETWRGWAQGPQGLSEPGGQTKERKARASGMAQQVKALAMQA